MNNFIISGDRIVCGHCGFVQPFSSTLGIINESHSINCCTRKNQDVTKIDKLRSALLPFAEMYESWRSSQGNPMMIANPDRLKDAWEALK